MRQWVPWMPLLGKILLCVCNSHASDSILKEEERGRTGGQTAHTELGWRFNLFFIARSFFPPGKFIPPCCIRPSFPCLWIVKKKHLPSTWHFKIFYIYSSKMSWLTAIFAFLLIPCLIFPLLFILCRAKIANNNFKCLVFISGVKPTIE